MEYYSAIKNEWNNVICSNMRESRDFHTEWSKLDRYGEISYDILYVESKRKWYKWTYNTESDSQT